MQIEVNNNNVTLTDDAGNSSVVSYYTQIDALKTDAQQLKSRIAIVLKIANVPYVEKEVDGCYTWNPEQPQTLYVSNVDGVYCLSPFSKIVSSYGSLMVNIKLDGAFDFAQCQHVVIE